MSDRTPRYREYLPAAPLRPLVECYWEWRGHFSPSNARTLAVLPDGCIDILFVFSGPPEAHSGSGGAVVGTMTSAQEVEYRPGYIDLLGVRFRPGGAAALLEVAAHELTDRTIGLEDLWGEASAGRLADRLQGTDPGDRGHLLDAEFLGRLASARIDPLVLRAARSLEVGTPLSVQHLSDVLGTSRRQLERRIRASVGLSPWGLARIARFRRAAKLLIDRPEYTLSRVAHEAGYCDQPHFTKEFGRLAGRSPGAYRREMET